MVERQIGGYRVATLGLAALIQTKQAAGRSKDLAVLPLLRRTLDESTKSRACWTPRLSVKLDPVDGIARRRPRRCGRDSADVSARAASPRRGGAK